MLNVKKGFTLIELLVVIAIIAMLLAIMVPALTKVKMQAQTLICATNLRNYGTALHSYASDNEDRAPFMISWLYSQETIERGEADRTCDRRCRWHYDGDEPDGSLWPYIESKDVHMCPTFANYARTATCPSSAHSDSTPYNPMYSYSMNYFLGFDWASGLRSTFTIAYEEEYSMKLSKVDSPSNCFAFSEENLWAVGIREGEDPKVYSWNVLNDNTLWMNANPDFPDGATDNFATYHNVSLDKKNWGYANAVFVDGRVEKVKGVPGREAYLTFAKPYRGHENQNIW